MNTRIQELKSQCEVEIWGENPYNGSPEFMGYELDAEKFAELIIKECIMMCKVEWYGDSLDTICDNLADHFGLE
jgi:hypothetical protein